MTFFCSYTLPPYTILSTSTPRILYTLTKVTLTGLLTTYLLSLSINTRAAYLYVAKARIKAFSAILSLLKDSDR